MGTTQHVPVLLTEVLHWLQPKPGRSFVDGTLGGGGYTRALVAVVGSTGQVIAIDRDEAALERFKIAGVSTNVILIHDSFANLNQICDQRGYNRYDGIVCDLGLSTDQLSDSSRGFTFVGAGSLDMRFDSSATELTAYKIVNGWSVQQLRNMLLHAGEEPLAMPIARAIVDSRKQAPITTPEKLAEIVNTVYKSHFSKPSRINPATRTFQALRITVNGELDALKEMLPQALYWLKPGGRLAIVSFHSLEDRMVKDFFRQESRDCICPPKAPVCQCEHKAQLKVLTKKPITPSAKEIAVNPRSRSAKLRVAERINMA